MSPNTVTLAWDSPRFENHHNFKDPIQQAPPLWGLKMGTSRPGGQQLDKVATFGWAVRRLVAILICYNLMYPRLYNEECAGKPSPGENHNKQDNNDPIDSARWVIPVSWQLGNVTQETILQEKVREYLIGCMNETFTMFTRNYSSGYVYFFYFCNNSDDYWPVSQRLSSDELCPFKTNASNKAAGIPSFVGADGRLPL